MEPKQLQAFCKLDRQCETLLRHSIRELQLSGRAYDRVLRVARTIADLANSQEIKEEHIFEAANYRALDRRLW
jgi:magnesium chelatase family protein